MKSERTAVAKSLLFIELNEFSPDMMREATRMLHLPHLRELLDLKRSETFTDDKIEHQGLDPWVQWVSIHTGISSSEHGIRRLGHTKKQNRPQIWDVLGSAELRWGAWGVMNAPRGENRNCAFFMPDPWSFEENAYPPPLDQLLALPRYAAKNYLEFSHTEIFRALAKLIRYFTPPSRWAILLKSLNQLVAGWKIAGANVHTLATLVDYIGVLTFVELRRQQHLDFSVIFLNHIAHLQHQFWQPDGPIDPNMAFGLRLCDAMIGLLNASRKPDEAILIANGLRQKNVAGQGWCVFRQKMPIEMLKRLGIVGARVEQCMTNDANLIFQTDEQADRAEAMLASCIMDNSREPAFFVERETPKRLFYQIAIEHRVPANASIISSAGSVSFHEVIELICERTGAHMQIGDVYSAGINVPSLLTNHKLFDVIAEHFGLNITGTTSNCSVEALV